MSQLAERWRQAENGQFDHCPFDYYGVTTKSVGRVNCINIASLIYISNDTGGRSVGCMNGSVDLSISRSIDCSVGRGRSVGRWVRRRSVGGFLADEVVQYKPFLVQIFSKHFK